MVWRGDGLYQQNDGTLPCCDWDIQVLQVHRHLKFMPAVVHTTENVLISSFSPLDMIAATIQQFLSVPSCKCREAVAARSLSIQLCGAIKQCDYRLRSVLIEGLLVSISRIVFSRIFVFFSMYPKMAFQILLIYWNAKLSKTFFLRSNFQPLEMFRVYPVFLWEKGAIIWGERFSIRTALIPLLSLRTTKITIKNKP